MSSIFPSITMNILFFEFFIIALHHSRKFNLAIFNFPPSCDYPKLNQRHIIIFKSVALLPIGTLLTLKINFRKETENAHQHKWRKWRKKKLLWLLATLLIRHLFIMGLWINVKYCVSLANRSGGGQQHCSINVSTYFDIMNACLSDK